MKNSDEDLYNIDTYTDEDLYSMLDMNNPTDRELEAKIVMTINKYDEMDGDEAKQMKSFFDKVYDRFFEDDEKIIELDEETVEGFEDMNQSKKSLKKENADNSALFGDSVLTDKSEADKALVQTTPLFYGASQLNPLLKETQKRVLQLDSQFRNYENYPYSTDYIINLSEHLHNVVSLRLHSVSIPYTWYNVSNVYNANYFKLLGNVDGIKDVFDLTFDISAGTYNTEQLVNAINTSIQDVAQKNTDIDFGSTGVAHDIETSKITLTLDIQQVYNETSFFIYFNYWSSPFDSSGTINAISNNLNTQTGRQLSIPGFLGYANLVIPKYSNANFVHNNLVSVPNAYSMESIYSHYDYCLNITGKKTPVGDPLQYNSFDPNQVFYIVINDPDKNVVGNNYFTITTFDGPNPYDLSSNILQEIKIEFCDVSGLYPRSFLLEEINRSLLQNEFLSSNASLNQIDISYNEKNTSEDLIVTMQRFQLRTLLNRKTTTKKRDGKQIVLFPDEDEVFDNLPVELRFNWTGPLWEGINSCFLFYNDNKFWQSNAVIAEANHLGTNFNIVSEPTMTIRCIKSGGVGGPYDVPANNRSLTIPTSIGAGFPDGYKLVNYFGVYSYDNVAAFSGLNAGFRNLNNSIDNGFVNVNAFYDVGASKCRIQIDLNTYFNETMYEFDITNSFLNDIDLNGNNTSAGGGTGFILTDSSYSVITGVNGPGSDASGNHDATLDLPVTGSILNIPISANANSNNQPLNVLYKKQATISNTIFPLTINDNNNLIIIDVSSTVPGLQGLVGQPNWPYRFHIPNGTYSQPFRLENAINNKFSSIQGETDSSGIPLYGLNLSQSKFRFAPSDQQSTSFFSWYLKLVVTNNLTQSDYILEFTDISNGVPYTSYENPWVDASNNERYSLDSSGLLVTSANLPLTGTSWNAFLGFSDVSYSLAPETEPGYTQSFIGKEVVAERDILKDISGSIFIYETDVTDPDGVIGFNQNNTITFIPQTNVSGLSDSSGVKRIQIEIPGGIYSYYNLLNAINIKLNDNEQTKGSVLYNYFSLSTDLDYTVFQMNINKVYTAQDYVLEFYNPTEVPITDKVRNITSANSFQAITWDVTLGWLLGFRSFPQINLNQTDASNSFYVDKQSYSLDPSSGIITLVGDTGIDLFLYKTLYLIIDDFTQNHLNDGLITGIRNTPLATKPSYSSNATKVCNPNTQRDQASIFSSSQPGMGLTDNQLYAANTIANNNFVSQITRIYSDPPFVKDMFAVIPIKVSSLNQGDLFTEYGGTLQDNDRKYFGPVNISKMNIKLLNDHGDVIDLNGNNWSFTLVFEYLYNMKGI